MLDLKDIDGRLVNGADHRAARVHGVAYGAHHNGCSARVQPCKCIHDGRRYEQCRLPICQLPSA